MSGLLGSFLLLLPVSPRAQTLEVVLHLVSAAQPFHEVHVETSCLDLTVLARRQNNKRAAHRLEGREGRVLLQPRWGWAYLLLEKTPTDVYVVS